MPGSRPWGAGPYGVQEWPKAFVTRDIAGASVTSFILEAGMARAWVAPDGCVAGDWTRTALT